jgi:hypothetical protein
VARGLRRVLLFGLALPLALAGCGLDFPIVLASPAQIPTTTGSLFLFGATAANVEPEFKGFEVYYKIYLPTSEYANEKYFATQFDLVQAGFRRLTSALDSTAAPQVPLLPVDPGDQGTVFEVTVDFVDPSNPEIYDDGAPAVPVAVAELRRSIPRAAPFSTEFKPFYEWDSTDADILHSPDILSVYISTNSSVLLRLFVLSFGLDFTGALYSTPVWIGDGSILFEDLG